MNGVSLLLAAAQSRTQASSLMIDSNSSPLIIWKPPWGVTLAASTLVSFSFSSITCRRGTWEWRAASAHFWSSSLIVSERFSNSSMRWAPASGWWKQTLWPPLGSCSCGKPNKRLQGEDIFGNIISKDSNLLQTLLGSLTSRPDRLCVKLEGKRHNQSKSHQRRTRKNHFSCQSHLEVGSAGIHVVKLSAIVVHPGKENCNTERSAKRMVNKRIYRDDRVSAPRHNPGVVIRVSKLDGKIWNCLGHTLHLKSGGCFYIKNVMYQYLHLLIVGEPVVLTFHPCSGQ